MNDESTSQTPGPLDTQKRPSRAMLVFSALAVIGILGLAAGAAYEKFATVGFTWSLLIWVALAVAYIIRFFYITGNDRQTKLGTANTWTADARLIWSRRFEAGGALLYLTSSTFLRWKFAYDCEECLSIVPYSVAPLFFASVLVDVALSAGMLLHSRLAGLIAAAISLVALLPPMDQQHAGIFVLLSTIGCLAALLALLGSNTYLAYRQHPIEHERYHSLALVVCVIAIVVSALIFGLFISGMVYKALQPEKPNGIPYLQPSSSPK